MECVVAQRNDFADFIEVRIFAVWREAHDFAFVTIFLVADEIADHGVETAEGMRQEDAIEDLYVVAFAARHHGRDEVAGTVITEAGGLLPRRAVVGAGNVREVMLYVVFLKPELGGIGIERLR